MEKFSEMLAQLQSLNIIQKELEWQECIPENIYQNYFQDNCKFITSGLNMDERRHYEKSISVVEMYGKYLGVMHISKLYSEQSTCEDCYVTIEFFEMEPITITSYKRKTNENKTI